MIIQYEHYAEDRLYHSEIIDDARLFQLAANVTGDKVVKAIIDNFLERLSILSLLVLNYYKHRSSGNMADVAWGMGFPIDDPDPDESDRQLTVDLQEFLQDLGFTDDDLRNKSMAELVHMDQVTGSIIDSIERAHGNYRTFLSLLPAA